MTVRTSVLWKINTAYGKKMARIGRTKVIYKGTFISIQTLRLLFFYLKFYVSAVDSTVEFDPRNRMSLKFSAPEVEFSTPDVELKTGSSASGSSGE